MDESLRPKTKGNETLDPSLKNTFKFQSRLVQKILQLLVSGKNLIKSCLDLVLLSQSYLGSAVFRSKSLLVEDCTEKVWPTF